MKTVKIRKDKNHLK